MKRNFILKSFVLSASLPMTLISGSLSSAEIVKMVKEIKKERVGVSLSTLENTGKPFMLYVPKVKEEKVVEEEAPKVLKILEVAYSLKAILNNAAFIDNKWYRQGDSLGEYTIGYVSSNSVVLKNTIRGNRTLKLKEKKKSFIKSNRGYK